MTRKLPSLQSFQVLGDARYAQEDFGTFIAEQSKTKNH